MKRRSLLAPVLAAFVAIASAASGRVAEAASLEAATFGSGCFWCTQAEFDEVEGVVATTPGYMGGRTAMPTYESVATGRTGHAEVLRVEYDPAKVSYQQLLDHYWRHVDPFDARGQFCDRGSQYRPVIFTHTPEQARLASQSKAMLEASGRFNRRIVVEITPASTFTAAERVHQGFYKRNPIRYAYYRHGCGRDARLRQIWGAEAKPPAALPSWRLW